jgi:hypothetical protein
VRTATGIVAAAGALVMLLGWRAAAGAVLPEDRADVLFHSYDGGGVTIQGPSMLVRKEFAGKFSASANYYIDDVSSASIDVITRASEYTEQRKQQSVGLDYLHDRWIMSLGLTSSEENDYSAETFTFGISQDIFGDLTTVTLGYSVGNDEVRRRGDPNFSEDVQRQQYRLGLSQVLTRNLLLGLSFETITDEGFLNNPYRAVRYLDGSGGYQYEPEVYPRTRSSDAASIRMRYYLPYRAALHAEYRRYSDTWEIAASQFELGYTHPLNNGITLEARIRGYSQDHAEFYSDLFPFSQAQNFMARDKELSTFTSTTLRVGASYDIVRSGWKFIDRGTINMSLDHIMFEYEDFRDLTVTGVAPGEEPLYSFDANVLQFFVSFWF